MQNEELKKKYTTRGAYKLALDAIVNDGKIKSIPGMAENLERTMVTYITGNNG
jgi:hypothetical protein